MSIVHSNQPFPYDHHQDRDGGDSARRVPTSRSRSSITQLKRSRKRSATTPSMGANARRNKRWGW
ncbi:MAG: hypothetical protein ACRCT8_17185 [Lacipirellulaceae bacterium]